MSPPPLPSGWSFLHDTLSDPSPKYDEHLTLREKKNEFAQFAYKVAKGEINIEGWRPIC